MPADLTSQDECRARGVGRPALPSAASTISASHSGSFERLIRLWKDSLEPETSDLSMSPEWTLRAAKSAGHLEHLRMLGVRTEDGRLAALATFLELRERIHGIAVRVRELPGRKLIAYHNEFPGDSDCGLLELIANAGQQQCDLLCVPAVPVASLTDRVVQEVAARNRWKVMRIPGHRSPFFAVSGTWDSYLAQKSSNFRYTLKRKRRTLEGLGRIEERWFETPESVDELLENVEQIEASSWKVGVNMAITESPVETAYYRELLPWLAAMGALRANVVFVNDIPAAYSLCCVWHGRVAQLKTSFSERFSEASPGLVVNATAIRRAFDSGDREFDFLGDVMPHKSHWTSSVREHDHLFLFARTPRGRIVWLMKSLIRKFRRSTVRSVEGRGQSRPGPSTG